MLIICPKCFTQYQILDEDTSLKGKKCHCSACGCYFDLADDVIELTSSHQKRDEVEKTMDVFSSVDKEPSSFLKDSYEPISLSLFNEPIKDEKEPKFEKSPFDYVPEEFKPVQSKKTPLLSLLIWLLLGAGICYAAYMQKDYLLNFMNKTIEKKFEISAAEPEKTKESISLKVEKMQPAELDAKAVQKVAIEDLNQIPLKEIQIENDLKPIDMAESVASALPIENNITEEENEILLFKDVNHLKKNLEPEFSVFLNNIDEIDIKNVSFISGSGCDQLFISSPTYISNYIKKFKLVTLYKEAVKISKIEKKSLFYVIIRYGISPLINKNYKFIDHSDFIKKCICKEKIKPKALKKKLKKMLRLNKVKTPHEKRLYTNLMFADQWTNTGNSILDVRMPFVDYELVEFCLFLNNKYKTNEGFTKYILRETMKNIIPNEILQRKDKGTLENSIARSIETSWEALLSITEINYLEKAGILRAGTIRKFLYLLKSSSSVYAYQMIMILELEFWLKSINGIIYKEA